MQSVVMWAALDAPGLEQARLEPHADGVVVSSTVLGAWPEPAALRYTLRLDSGWRVREIRLTIDGDALASLQLHSDGAGRWSDADGRSLPELGGCVDLDITATPLTNTLPIRRLALEPGQSAELLVAYMQVPLLLAAPERQRYTCLERHANSARYRYESLDTGFVAELPVDADGLVLDYPELFTRVWPR